LQDVPLELHELSTPPIVFLSLGCEPPGSFQALKGEAAVVFLHFFLKPGRDFVRIHWAEAGVLILKRAIEFDFQLKKAVDHCLPELGCLLRVVQ
jgi:hypothetical protein